jgi:hypothetical protein
MKDLINQEFNKDYSNEMISFMHSTIIGNGYKFDSIHDVIYFTELYKPDWILLLSRFNKDRIWIKF